MLTDSAIVFADVDIDSPWRRLHWTLPLALLICACASILFVYYMEHSVSHTPEPVPVDAELIELPMPARQQSTSRPRLPDRPVELPIRQEPPSNLSENVAPPVQPISSTSTNNTVEHDVNRSAQAIVQPLPAIPDDLRQEAMNEVAKARFHIAIDGSVTVGGGVGEGVSVGKRMGSGKAVGVLMWAWVWA